MVDFSASLSVNGGNTRELVPLELDFTVTMTVTVDEGMLTSIVEGSSAKESKLYRSFGGAAAVRVADDVSKLLVEEVLEA